MRLSLRFRGDKRKGPSQMDKRKQSRRGGR